MRLGILITDLIDGGIVKKFLAMSMAAVLVLGVGTTVAVAEPNYTGGDIPSGGILTKAGGPYLITKPIVILEGQTLFVEPGVSILANPESRAGVRYLFDLRGSLNIQGSSTAPVRIVALGANVRLIDSYNYKGREPLAFFGSFVRFENFQFSIDKFGNYELHNSDFDRGSLSISTSGYRMADSVSLSTLVFERNTLDNVAFSLTRGLGNYTINNNYFNFKSKGMTIWPSFGDVNLGSFQLALNTFKFVDPQSLLRSTYRRGSIDVSSNYWGTSNENEIQRRIFDGNDQRGLEIVAYQPWLLSADPGTPRISVRESLDKKSRTKFKNCAALNKVFPAGLGESIKYPVTLSTLSKLPFGSSAGYKINKVLDVDKDKIACEK